MISKCVKMLQFYDFKMCQTLHILYQSQTEWYLCVRAGKGDSSIGRVILCVPGANG